MSRLVVHLNGSELYDVEPAAGALETSGDFAVEFRNHGQPVHVHLRPDDALSAVTAVDGTNHYVESEAALVVEVPVTAGTAGTSGSLDVVTGYGKGSATVQVSVTEGDGGESVPVDDELGRRAGDEDDPAPPDPDGTPGGRTATHGLAASLGGRLPSPAVPGPLARGAASRSTVALVALAVAALVLSGVAALTAGPGLAVVAGIFAVLVGLSVAGYVMAR